MHQLLTSFTAPGIPTNYHMQRMFWAFVGSAIGVAVIANVLNQILYRQRIAAAIQKISQPARPRSIFFQTHATISAVVREVANYSKSWKIGKSGVFLPPMGGVLIMVAYIVLITVCCFYRLNTKSFLQWEAIGYRSGFIALAQLPLIILLSGKRNIIGCLTGMGYERLLWLHRWAARALLFTIIIHFGYWMTTWGKFNYIATKVNTDPLTQRGLIAGGILVWIVLSSIAPLRKLSYEVFVVQHILSWLGLLIAIYFHIPEQNKIWLWIPLGFWLFDRVVRSAYLMYNNLSLFHKGKSGLLACKASFVPVDSTHTRITISNPPISWKAGQHVVLSCHPLAPLSSHPFTIASLPEDGRMEFLVQSKGGATKRFLNYASKMHLALPQSSAPAEGRSVLIEGPYSQIRPLRQFDSIVFIAGATGATFTVPLLRDIVLQWTGKSAQQKFEPGRGAVTRHIRFVWVVKQRSSIAWFSHQLDQVVRDVEMLRNEGHEVAVDISIYVTCDDTISGGQSQSKFDTAAPEYSSSKSSSIDEKKEHVTLLETVNSRSSSPQGGCCCTRIIDDEDAITAPCNCASKNLQPNSCSAPSLSDEKTNTLINVTIPLLGGRPNVENIIRKQAEVAWGEMAVVVCGPKALIQCTRNACVKISDDRGVHKGTGAQGIYVHAECFGYA